MAFLNALSERGLKPPEVMRAGRLKVAEAKAQQRLYRRFPRAMALESIKPAHTKKPVETFKNGYFSAITADEIRNSRECFMVLYEIYERRPFLEMIADQATLENVPAEITFGISDDAFRCDVLVNEPDRWLVPQANVAVDFEDGFCEAILTPIDDQYGEVDVFIEVEDVGGISKHDFTLKIAEDPVKARQREEDKRKGRVRIRRPARAGMVSADVLDEDFEERSKNPHHWTPAHVCDWLLENGLSKFAKRFATKEVTGEQMLKLTSEELREQYGVAKPRDRTKFTMLLAKLNEEAEIAVHAEAEAQAEEAERTKLRAEKERRRAIARGHTSGGGSTDGSNGNQGGAGGKDPDSGIDPWLCGHVPRISRGECGNVDLDSYAISLELHKLLRLDHMMLRDAMLVDLMAGDARLILAAALSGPFLRLVGLESDERRRTTGKRFVERYNSRFRHSMPREKHSQRISVVADLPSDYDNIRDAQVVLCEWPRMEDTFYPDKKRFFVWTDFISILGEMRAGGALLVFDDVNLPPPDETDPEVRSMALRPGNSLEGWKLLRQELHRFSWGKRIVYTYRKMINMSASDLEMMEYIRDEDEAEQKQLAELKLLAEESDVSTTTGVGTKM